MQLKRQLRDDSGSALITALMCTVVMLMLGLALLSIVDTQASESKTERSRDHAFNLSESVLNGQAFVLGRNWPDSVSAAPVGNPACKTALAGFGSAVGAAASGVAAVERLRPSINSAYTDAAYSGASWQVHLCDDDNVSSVWNDANLNNKSWDSNGNKKLWVHVQSVVGGKTRQIAGLVKVLETSALNAKYGLVSGSIAEDLGPTTGALTNTTLVTSLTNGLINTNPLVAEDSAYPVPASGVTGLRCGLLDNITQVKTCVSGAIGALASVPLVNTLVTNGRMEQFPTTNSTTDNAIGQMRKKAVDAGTYVTTTSGSGSASGAPLCTLPAAATSSSIVFIEKVGDGDQYCYIDVSTSKTYKALVIGSGRVIIRGSNTITPYSTSTSNRLTAVVYALNLQTADHTVSSPAKPVVRIEKGARVTGAVHADGKNAQVNVVAPDFDSVALINGLLCPGLLCALAPTVTGLLATTGLNGVLDGLISGCIGVKLLGACVGVNTAAAGITLNSITGGITSQLSTYGSAIHADVGVINALKVYGDSGVVSGTFRDLQAR